MHRISDIILQHWFGTAIRNSVTPGESYFNKSHQHTLSTTKMKFYSGIHLFLLASLLPPSQAFQPASRGRLQSHPSGASFSSPQIYHRYDSISLRVTILDEEEQAIDVKYEGVRVKKESARLSKAKQLLEQFTVEKEQEINSGSNATSSAATSTRMSRFPLVVSKEQGVDKNSNNNVVPDQYWSNGHLQGGNYVTRWAQGVKVAEPLIKYDPVAAEKLLFRQPAKWLVRNTQIALPIGLWAAGVVADYGFGRSKQNRRQRAKQLLNAISNLGPAIIKGGRWCLLFRC